MILNSLKDDEELGLKWCKICHQLIRESARQAFWKGFTNLLFWKFNSNSVDIDFDAFWKKHDELCAKENIHCSAKAWANEGKN